MQNSKLQFKIRSPKLLLILGLLFLPYSVFAASVYLETARTEFFVGDTILVEVKVDPDGKEINIVEGNISLNYPPEAISIRDISLAESSFSLWPSKPILSEDSKNISFVGGVPGGLSHQDATLFKFALNLKTSGPVTLSPTGISVYLNDGRGTKDAVSVRGLTINVSPAGAGYSPVNELEAMIVEDRTPPRPFEILAGQDSSIFDGKKFLSFSTTDEQSGVKYYEVIEGDLPPVRSNGTYVLQNQDQPTKVTVIAYDGAGNSRESTYRPRAFGLPHLIGITLILLIAATIYRRRRRSTREIATNI